MSSHHDEDERIDLNVEGMHCASCALNIERHLRGLGVTDAAVDFSTKSASFTPSQRVSIPFVREEIEKLGYKSSLHAASLDHSRRLNTIEKKFLFCAVFTVPLFVHVFVPIQLLHNLWLQLILATPVFLVGFFHFGRSAFLSLRARLPHMDVLIFMGITAAFAYSLIGTLLGLGHDYAFYETAATITTVVLLGNLLEARAVKKTTSAIEELAQLQATSAKRITVDQGSERVIEINAKDIQVGDLLLVNTGDKIPTDGIVATGTGSINESIVSGESLPVEKSPGDAVIGGTLVARGSIKVRASAVGEHTVLASMIRLVKEAQRNKPRIQRIGDEVSAVFVPVVLVIAALTFTVSVFFFHVPLGAALLRSIAVLVIACPCAMGLATPTAVMVGVGEAAKRGVLFRGGDVLERMSQLKQIVFDKTGTITTGEFRLVNLRAIAHRDESFLKSLLASIERHSSHPIANSIRKELGGAPLYELTHVEEQSGLGMKALDTAGKCYLVGSFASAKKATTDDSHDLYILENETLIGTVSLVDEPKPFARETIAKLKALGFEPILLSGDKTKKCQALAGELGIERFFAEKLPEEKLRIIEALDQEKLTGFVGDGINDAPALSRASVGISLSDATEAAIQSAQIVLLKGRFESLLTALLISRMTMRVIKQNLFWAFCYNVLAIPIAAVGLLTPAIACFAMALSDVVVVGNSLRLKSQPFDNLLADSRH